MALFCVLLLQGECAAPTTGDGGGGAPSGGGGGDAPWEDNALLRVGMGVHVLNLGDIDYKAAKFYADFQARAPPL